MGDGSASARTGQLRSRVLRWLGWAVVGGYLAISLVHIATHPARYQWDFRTYYYAASAYQADLDPYRLRSLTQVAGSEVGFPFVYPPFALILFSPFTALEFPVAYLLFLALKILGFLGLLAVWRRGFLTESIRPRFVAFLLLGFGGALIVDLTAGNVGIFEQLALWLAFLALRRGRPAAFCAGVLAASVFKLLPIVFLGLLLLTNVRRRFRWFVGGVSAFLAYLALNAVLWPGFTSSFVRGSTHLDSRGIKGPSSLALMRDVGDLLAGRGLAVPAEIIDGAYLVAAMAILAISLWALRRGRRSGLPMLIYLSCLAFVLAAPRMKDYGYVLVLLPAYMVLLAGYPQVDGALVLILLAVSPRLFMPFQSSAALSGLVWSYAPLFGAALLWAMQVRAVAVGSGPPAPRVTIQSVDYHPALGGTEADPSEAPGKSPSGQS